MTKDLTIRNSTAEFLIFNSQELDKDSVIRKFRNTASDGKSDFDQATQKLLQQKDKDS